MFKESEPQIKLPVCIIRNLAVDAHLCETFFASVISSPTYMDIYTLRLNKLALAFSLHLYQAQSTQMQKKSPQYS